MISSLDASTTTSRRGFTQRCGLAVVMVTLLTSSAFSSPNWSRMLADARSFSETPGLSFVVAKIEYENYVFSAMCWFRYITGTNPTILHGKKDTDGKFSPVVTYEVATEGKTKWERISPEVPQPATDTIVVSPDNPIVELYVNMKPFRKTVGLSRYGRIILENGAMAVFELEDLLPTEDAVDRNGNLKRIVFETDEYKIENGYPKEGLGAPASVVSISSIGNRLIGTLIYEAPPERTVTLEGTKTLDDDFWPKATLQWAGADYIWRTIGESQNEGTSATLEIPAGRGDKIRVVLSDYRPLIGKSKFGKVLFSNGQSAIFSLDLLRPESNN